MDKIFQEGTEAKNRYKKEQEIIKMDIEKEIVIYEKKLKDLESKCYDKEKVLEQTKDQIETINLKWKSKMKILESENKNQSENYANIIETLELELETKNQHLVSLKRDLSNFNDKYTSVVIEKTQREEEVNMLYQKVQTYIDDSKKTEELNNNNVEDLEKRFKDILSSKNEKIQMCKDEISKLKSALVSVQKRL